jgi:dipeptidase E
MKRNLLLISSSRQNRKAQTLAHAREAIIELLGDRRSLTFVPYARPDGISHADYSGSIARAFSDLGLPYEVKGLEQFPVAAEGILQAEAIFVGGGNTFLLRNDISPLMELIQKRVREEGMPYMGSSAGSNMAGFSLHTTNDMPIIYPPGFDALDLIHFNINPHYPRPQSEDSMHSGESRDQRLSEFHSVPANRQPVAALREDSMLFVSGKKIELRSAAGSPVKVFLQGKAPEEYPVGTDLSFLEKW